MKKILWIVICMVMLFAVCSMAVACDVIDKLKGTEKVEPSEVEQSDTTPEGIGIDHDDHVYGEWRIVKSATCQETGLKERACVCGKKETEEIPVGTHRYEYNRCVFCSRWIDTQAEGTPGLIFELNASLNVGEVSGYALVGYEGTESDVVIPATYEGIPVTAWGEDVFTDFGYLTSIVIPESITYIEEDFNRYRLLTDVIYEGDLESWMKIRVYGGWESASPLYNECNFYIDHYPVTTLVIPDGTKNVPGKHFGGGNFTEVVIPEGVEEIWGDAFYGCVRLKKVSIPSTVTFISESMLQNCSRLERVDYAGDLESWCAIEFARYAAPPINHPHDFYIQGELLVDLVIPESVTTIGYGTFGGCTSIRSVTLHAEIEEIEEDAFINCKNIDTIINQSSLEVELGEEDGNGGIAYYAARIIVGGNEMSSTGESFKEGDCIMKIDGDDKILVEYIGTEERSFTVPNGVTIIGEDAFAYHHELTEIIISDSVKRIEEDAFYGCISLVKLTIGRGVEDVDGPVGYGTPKLVQICNNSSLELSAISLLYGIDLEELDDEKREEFLDYFGIDPDYIEMKGGRGEAFTGELLTDRDGLILYRIGREVFFMGYCGEGTTLDLSGKGITKLFSMACADLTLEKCVIPEGITELPMYTFEGISCIDIYLPRSLRTIASYCFDHMDGRPSIHYAGTMAEWDAIEKGEDAVDESVIYCADGKKLPHIHRWEDVIVREATCMYGKIVKKRCRDCGEYDSGSSTGGRIDHVYDDQGVCIYCHNESRFFFTAYPYLVSEEEIEYYSVGYFGTEKTVTIPESYNGKPVKSIDYNGGIVDDELVSLVIPKSIESIDTWGISSEKVRWVYCFGTPADKDKIRMWDSGNAFSLYTEWFFYSETEPAEGGNYWHYVDGRIRVWGLDGEPVYQEALAYSLKDDGTYEVTGMGSFTGSDLVIPAQYRGIAVTSIEGSAFYNRTGLETLVIENGITEIGDQAFHGCSGLTSVTIPASVKVIGESSFSWCNAFTLYYQGNIAQWCEISDLESLTGYLGRPIYVDGAVLEGDIVIPEGVTEIPSGAFYCRRGITSITIPEGVRKIGECAFAYCESLRSIVIPSTVREIEWYAFSGCNDLEYVTFAEGSQLTSIGEDIFQYTYYLDWMLLPDTVEEIWGDILTYSRNARIYYLGTKEKYATIMIKGEDMLSSSVCYYSETVPEDDGAYWHYVNGEIVEW